MHEELFAELLFRGLRVLPGEMGENITTAGLPVLELSGGAVPRIGEQALVRITGLRNPCAQIESFMPGLLAAMLDRGPDGGLVRKAGVMGVVVESGNVPPGDRVAIVRSPLPHKALPPV